MILSLIVRKACVNSLLIPYRLLYAVIWRIIEYLPIALGLLKVEHPDLYCLIIDYYYAEKRVSMASLGKRHGLSTDTVRYRIKSAKEKLKAYIIMHENHARILKFHA